jgi:hypothetical protein
MRRQSIPRARQVQARRNARISARSAGSEARSQGYWKQGLDRGPELVLDGVADAREGQRWNPVAQLCQGRGGALREQVVAQCCELARLGEDPLERAERGDDAPDRARVLRGAAGCPGRGRPEDVQAAPGERGAGDHQGAACEAGQLFDSRGAQDQPEARARALRRRRANGGAGGRRRRDGTPHVVSIRKARFQRAVAPMWARLSRRSPSG